MKTTIRAKLVAVQEGAYSNYVFQNLDTEEKDFDRYITVTKCPNWQYSVDLRIGDIGFLQYEYAESGQEYYDASSNTIKTYRYTSLYFINFIKETKDTTKEFNF